MTCKLFLMFGHRYLILTLFFFLATLSTKAPLAVSEIVISPFEVVMESEHGPKHAIIELISFPYQLFVTSQSGKLPFAQFSKQSQTEPYIHESRLLYFKIGNTIEIGLTSTAIIYPFHCFT